MFAPRTLTRTLLLEARSSSAFTWEDVGWQRLSQLCLGLQLLLLGTSLALYRATDIDVQWSSGVGFLAFTGLLVAVWATLVLVPGTSTARQRVTEAFAAIIVFLLLIQITAPIQYGALAVGRPFIDG